MNRTRLCLAAVLAASSFAPMARAQETNVYPKSRLEIFEERTGAVLIRGTDDIGVVAGKTSGVTVRCRETRDMGTNQREFGVIVIVTQAEGAEDATVVDYDELDALIRSTDYVGKVEWSVTPLRHFEAGYTTRSGLKVASYSSRRSGTIEAFVLSNRLVRCRSSLTVGQLAEFRLLLEQAKAKIEVLQKTK